MRLQSRYVDNLLTKSRKIWKSIAEQNFNIFGCYDSSGGNFVSIPLAEQPQSYLTLDKAIMNLLDGVSDSNKKTITTLCQFRDLIQLPKDKPTMPLIMFYFPYARDKLVSAGNLTNNIKATLEKLNQIYGETSVDLITKIKKFIDFFDSTGRYFCERYIKTIDALHDGRYSFLYQSFVSTQIQHVAETIPLEFTFWIGNHIRMTFGNCTKEESTEILRVLLWLMELFPIAKTLEYDIKIFLLDVPKMFPPRNGDFITPRNVNSGYTIRYTTNLRKIFVYRREEHIKVLIHEFLHSIECDSDVSNEPDIVKFIESIKLETTPMFAELNPKDIKDLSEIRKNAESVANPNETLAEIGANILNIIHLILQRKENNAAFYRYFHKEREHALRQCAKIYKHFGGFDNPIRQTTNVIPYYILRAAAYFNESKLFEYLDLNNDICYILPAQKNVAKIFKELGFTGFPPGFKSTIQKIINSGIDVQKQSLRMTISDLD